MVCDGAAFPKSKGQSGSFCHLQMVFQTEEHDGREMHKKKMNGIGVMIEKVGIMCIRNTKRDAYMWMKVLS